MYKRVIKFYRDMPYHAQAIGLDREGGRFKIVRKRKNPQVPNLEKRYFKEGEQPEGQIDEDLFPARPQAPAGTRNRTGNLARRNFGKPQSGIRNFHQPQGPNNMRAQNLVKNSYGSKTTGTHVEDEQPATDVADLGSHMPPPVETPPEEFDYADAIIQAAVEGQPTDVQAAFDAAMKNRLTQMVDDYKVGLARNLFNPDVPPEEMSADDDASVESDYEADEEDDDEETSQEGKE